MSVSYTSKNKTGNLIAKDEAFSLMFEIFVYIEANSNPYWFSSSMKEKFRKIDI